MLLFEGTSWEHQAYAAGGAIVFKRKVIVVMRWVGISNVRRQLAYRLVTPQLMGKGVRRR